MLSICRSCSTPSWPLRPDRKHLEIVLPKAEKLLGLWIRAGVFFSAFSQCPFPCPSPPLLTEQDLKRRIQSPAWKPFVGGDGHSSEADFFTSGESQTCCRILCVPISLCMCIKTSLCCRWGGREGIWGLSAWSVMWVFFFIPHILHHESRGASQMGVKNASVVCCKNR